MVAGLPPFEIAITSNRSSGWSGDWNNKIDVEKGRSKWTLWTRIWWIRATEKPEQCIRRNRLNWDFIRQSRRSLTSWTPNNVLLTEFLQFLPHPGWIQWAWIKIAQQRWLLLVLLLSCLLQKWGMRLQYKKRCQMPTYRAMFACYRTTSPELGRTIC